mgnify:CR=1 FL=1
MDLQDKVINAFKHHFNAPPDYLVRAPGRVNIIGEHTDYNDGYVLPMAIDLAVWVALRPREDRRVYLRSLEKEEPAEFELKDIQHDSGHWPEYVKGMAVMLQETGYVLNGWEGVLTSDVPVGSGLSSSAALEMAVAMSFSVVTSFPFDGVEMARLGQKSENEWVGANTGIMDQLVSANGMAGHALFIDCRDLTIEAIPLPEGTAIVVMDTMTHHKHAESGYNDRRASCERAAEILGKTHLRDVTYAELQGFSNILDHVTYRRARHVITENQRVLDAVRAMMDGDSATLGQLMNASHASLRDDFEVTTDALNTMVKIAQEQDGCHGARMTGGGFGGCAVALVNTGQVEGILRAVAGQYEAATGIPPNVFFTNAAGGTTLIPVRNQGEG